MQSQQPNAELVVYRTLAVVAIVLLVGYVLAMRVYQ